MWPCTNDSDNDGHCNVCIRASNASCRKRKNVWLGTSIENQDFANKRLPYLHGAKRYGLCDTTFVSAEPLVGPIMLHGEVDGFKYRHLQEPGIDWVITGGESGPDARPSHSDWYRSLLRQCIRSGTPFFFKQWGEWCPGGFGGIHSSKPVTFVTIDGQTSQDASLWETDDGVEMQTRVGKKVAGRLLDGLVWNEFPAAIDEVAA
jgi:protein gp37